MYVCVHADVWTLDGKHVYRKYILFILIRWVRFTVHLKRMSHLTHDDNFMKS